jgi:hypothetical protein
MISLQALLLVSLTVPLCVSIPVVLTVWACTRGTVVTSETQQTALSVAVLAVRSL